MISQPISMKNEELNFEEFSSATKSDWEEKVLKELKKGDFESFFNWQLEDGTQLHRYYDKSGTEDKTTVDIPPRPPLSGDSATPVNYERVVVSDAISANEQALEALNLGATGVLFEVGSNEVQITDLLKNIKAEFAAVSFLSGNAQVVNDFAEFVKENSVNLGAVSGLCGGSKNKPPLAENRFQQIQVLSEFPCYFPFLLGGFDPSLTASDELALVCCELAQLVEEGEGQGLNANQILAKIAVSSHLSTDFFLEVAKLRALRYLVQKVVSAYKIGTESKYHLMVELPKWECSELGPHEDLLKGTTAGIAAIIGGADSICIYDNVEQKNQRLLRNIGNILIEEAHIAKTADPARGSYFVEHLTATLVSQSWEKFLKFERDGGFTVVYPKFSKSPPV